MFSIADYQEAGRKMQKIMQNMTLFPLHTLKKIQHISTFFLIHLVTENFQAFVTIKWRFLWKILVSETQNISNFKL